MQDDLSIPVLIPGGREAASAQAGRKSGILRNIKGISRKLVNPLVLAVLTGASGCRCEAGVDVGVEFDIKPVRDNGSVRVGGDRMTGGGSMAVAPAYRSTLGGSSCEVSRIVIARDDGMEADLDCPNGNFHMAMDCPGFNMKEGRVDCPKGDLHLTVTKDGRVVAGE